MIKSLITFIACLAGLSAFTHDFGFLKGIVTEMETNQPIAGANILIDRTMLGTVTDINGNFEFRNIHEGKYELIISYLGYTTIRKEATVIADKETFIEIELEYAELQIEPISVYAERPYSSASIKYIRKVDLEIRPNKSSQDLLKLVPGLITAQHAGGGKAEQIFIRGFDCDHGTDINISVDGLPVNMVSHGHGQGYADLHFLIPELVEEIEVYKGPYFGEFGNLATAGSVRFRTADVLKNNLVKLEGGQFNTFKGTVLYQVGKGGSEQNGYIATQFYNTDGPFESPINLQRMNVFGKYFVNLGHNSKLTFSVSSFSSAWDASGQIPDRVVKDGYIDRFGAIDDMEGGNTSRTDFSVQYDIRDDDFNKFSLQGYFTNYDFKLFSNFTYYLEDTIHGDMIEQLDNRTIGGLNARYSHLVEHQNTLFKTTFGGGFRSDNIAIGLNHSPDRVKMDMISDADIYERNIFAWIEEEIVFSQKFRTQFSLRGDYFTFNVNDHIASAPDTIYNEPHASGYAQSGILNPKINLVFTPIRNFEIYVNGGSGFHSNDARSVILSEKIDELQKSWTKSGMTEDEINDQLAKLQLDESYTQTETLPRALAAEFGLRSNVFEQLNVGLAGWYLHLEKEYVYVGDGGFAELSNPTQRIGFDLEIRYKINSWLWADADLTFSKGKILNVPTDENNIPLAPQITSTGGISLRDFHKFDASLRYIYIGDRPANESNTVTALGYLIFNLGMAYHLNTFTFSLIIENMLDNEWNEAQFDTESRMKWESEPVSEIHFTPGNPRNFQAGISYRF